MKIILAMACAGLAAFAGFLACLLNGPPAEVKTAAPAAEAAPTVPAPEAAAVEPVVAPEVVTPAAAVAAPSVAETPQGPELQYERFSRAGHRIKKPVKAKAPGAP